MTSDKLVHKNIIVSGRVQGVFFRASTVNRAHELDIKGFVKNRLDGTVYIEAEALPEQLGLFIDWCRQGPMYAHVESVNTSEGKLVGYEGFVIKR